MPIQREIDDSEVVVLKTGRKSGTIVIDQNDIKRDIQEAEKVKRFNRMLRESDIMFVNSILAKNDEELSKYYKVPTKDSNNYVCITLKNQNLNSLRINVNLIKAKSISEGNEIVFDKIINEENNPTAKIVVKIVKND